MEDKKQAIFSSARKLFSLNGFKETSVSEIAEQAGIGTGTFYNYYASKEELFLAVFIKENSDLKKSMFEVLDPRDDPVAVAAKMMTQYITATNSNRILKEWYNRELFSKLERYFYQQNGLHSIDDLIHNDIAALIKNWKAEGRIRKDIDDDLILAILSAPVYIDMHKTEIGIQYFPQMIALLFEFILKGLSDFRKTEK
jgi:AcrR family transcriptional regulator